MYLDPSQYRLYNYAILVLLSIIVYFFIRELPSAQLIRRKRINILVLLYVFSFIFIVGFRPVSNVFGDTVNYARTYLDFSESSIPPLWTSRDPLFYILMWLCSQYLDVRWFFFFVEIVYVIPLIWASYRFFRNNYDIALLVCFAAFSFFEYGVNGIRNGAACSLVFLALTYIQGNWKNKTIFAIISLIAISIHTSVALPIVCIVVASIVKNPRIMFFFWVFSLLISLVAGGIISRAFVNFGFDERLSDYILTEAEEGIFSRVGFRWDFLVYSAVPIVLGYFFIFVKKRYDRNYILLLGTYVFSNAFWLMVIRAQYSNRFAYLSWFLYPFVLIYPFLKINVWQKSQGRKAGIMMLGHLSFTLFMVFIYG